MTTKDQQVKARKQDIEEALTIGCSPYLRYAADRLLQSKDSTYILWHTFLHDFGIRNPSAAAETWQEISTKEQKP